jgi:2'-5' RNA ligase
VITAVVCAAFDGPTDAAILAARELVRAAGIRLPDRPAHRPHLSLAAARVAPAELPRVLDLAAEVAARHEPIAITLDEVGRFERAGVVWLGPSAPSAGSAGPAGSASLARLQREVDAALRAAGWPRAFGERSAPDQWVAHCTLATRIPASRLRAGQSTVRERYRPITARIVALATILVGGRGDVGHAALGAR